MKSYIYIIILLMMLPLSVVGQKVTLGSAKLKDGGDYNGELVSGNMKANTRRVSVRAMASTRSLMVKNTRASGIRISSMARASIISRTIIDTTVFGFVTISMVTALCIISTVTSMMANGSKINDQGRGFTYLLAVPIIAVTG